MPNVFFRATILLCTAVSVQVATVTGQSQFHMRYGSDFMDISNKAIETAGGDHLVAGTTLGFGSASNAVLMKLDDQGAPIWIRDYAGINSDEIFDMFETSQGEIVVCGGTSSEGVGSWDGFVMKLDSAGNMLWGRTYGNEYGDLFYAIREDPNGGYIATGYAQTTDFPTTLGSVLVKLDPMGMVIWSRFIPNGWVPQGGGNYPLDVAIMPDSSYLYTTCSYNNGNILNFYNFSNTGQLLWSKAYWVRSQGHKLAVDSLGNIYVTCLRLDGGVAMSVDMAVLKMDATGNVLWHKSYGGTYGELPRDIVIASDGNPVICGVTNSDGNGGDDAFLLKIDGGGSVQWCRTYGTVWTDVPASVHQTADEGFILAGVTYAYGTNTDSLKMHVIRTDSIGNTTCNSAPWPLIQLNDTVTVETPLAVDTLALQQTAITWASNYRTFYATSICGATLVTELGEDQARITVHPNPFQGSVVVTLPEGTGNSVELRVVDLVGRVVHAESGIDARKGSARTIQLENLSAGVYVLQVMLDERPRSIRIVKE